MSRPTPSGMPFFGDLARMLGQQGPVAGTPPASSPTPSPPAASPSERRPARAHPLEQLARVAELHVRPRHRARHLDHRPAAVDRAGHPHPAGCGQPSTPTGPCFERLADVARPVARPPPAHPSTDVTRSSDPAGDPAAAWLGNAHADAHADDAGHDGGLDGRPPGQPHASASTTCPIPRPPSDELHAWSSPTSTRSATSGACRADDLRLWVCLHEIAHHAVLGVPHVRRRLDDAHPASTSPASEPDPDALEERIGRPRPRADPSGMAGHPAAVRRPRGAPRRHPVARAAGRCSPQLDALVAVIVGYVDHVMDRVGETLIGSYGDGHRGAAPPPGRGRRRPTASSSACSASSSPRPATTAAPPSSTAWSSGPARTASTACGAAERELPTPAEVDAPGLWLARIDLPERLTRPPERRSG